MTNEELVALIQAGVDVQENMGQLYQQNRNFIVKIVLPYSKSCEMDDLMQEASRVGINNITTDGIHLTPLGHQFLAKKIYSSLTERL